MTEVVELAMQHIFLASMQSLMVLDLSTAGVKAGILALYPPTVSAQKTKLVLLNTTLSSTIFFNLGLQMF